MTEDNERYWAEQAEKTRGEAEPKRRVYRCRDRMCGGEDCATCQGESAAQDFMNQQQEEEQ
jgi:hypothetical protein